MRTRQTGVGAVACAVLVAGLLAAAGGPNARLARDVDLDRRLSDRQGALSVRAAHVAPTSIQRTAETTTC